MKKILIILFICLVFSQTYSFAGLFKKSEKAPLFFTPYNPEDISGYDTKIESVNVFKKGDRIYFSLYNPKGFKSDFIRYQIVKQDDNAHTGGYSRVGSKTVRVKNKNYYSDYFVLNSKGKYFLQVFDIQNLHQWIVMGAFAVFDE